jgi:DNA polymerase III subunit delta'
MTSNLFNQTLPQALLLHGSEHAPALDIVEQLIIHTLCESPQKNCGHCRACLFIQQKTHPDVSWITPEKPGAAIKIDQIRKMQLAVYQTPQCATHRIICIYPANELNRAASNALLKILEEPPKHAHFILLATHLDTLPATIISRCQTHQQKEPKRILDSNTPGYLSIGLHYDETTPRGILFKNQHAIIHQICDLSEHQTSVCQLVAEYPKYQLIDWLWFLHLFTATLLQHQLTPKTPVFTDHRVQQLASKHSPLHYFKQLDMILAFTKKINLDMPLNLALTLETLLIGYV